MRILVIAPHADDETLGCGGTIAKAVRDGHDVVVAVMTGHGPDPHPLWPRSVWDVVRGEARQAMPVLGVTDLRFCELPAVLIPDLPRHELNRACGELLNEVAPDELYVPFPLDLHGDHRELFHAFSVAWRPTTAVGRGIRRILAYETLSETHWNIPYVEQGFVPNVWNDISSTLDTKLEAMSRYASQVRPFPDARSIEALQALAQFRGAQVGVPAAESFVLVRALD
jgi:LmbE family N-acetylglucosaminyl deacetylase